MMADADLNIRQFTRSEWTLADLRSFVDEVEAMDGASKVEFTAPVAGTWTAFDSGIRAVEDIA